MKAVVATPRMFSNPFIELVVVPWVVQWVVQIRIDCRDRHREYRSVGKNHRSARCSSIRIGSSWTFRRWRYSRFEYKRLNFANMSHRYVEKNITKMLPRNIPLKNIPLKKSSKKYSCFNMRIAIEYVWRPWGCLWHSVRTGQWPTWFQPQWECRVRYRQW